MSTNFRSIELISRMKTACSRIFANKKDLESVRELQKLINEAPPPIVKVLEPIIFSVFVPILKSISEDRSNFKEKEKEEIVKTFRLFFEKINIEKLQLFFNFYGFLLFEIYDHKNNTVLNISEEYKLAIVECMTALVSCLDSSIIEKLYVKENAPKLCQMIYAVIELAKKEQFKTLRLAAIKCLMALAHVLEDKDFEDLVILNEIAQVFLFFLPGIATHLKSIALIEEKFGHRIPALALKAWGRIVTLLMQDYNSSDQKLKITSLDRERAKLTKWENVDELQEYIKNTSRSPNWYKQTDQKLCHIIREFAQLTHHSHRLVRLELVNLSILLIEKCVNTMPTSIVQIVDLVIICSEDEDDLVAEKSRILLRNLSNKITNDEFKYLLDSLEENFYNMINTIPRKFNGSDEKIQSVTLNSLKGYITLFGKHGTKQILYSPAHLSRLIMTLIHISEFETSNLSILEDYSTTDYEVGDSPKMFWKRFRHFRDLSILSKIENICVLLAKFGAAEIICDFLLDRFNEERKESIFLLNEFLAGIESVEENLNVFKNIIATYMDSANWYLPLTPQIDENGYEVTLSDTQSNILQVCLLVEGLGKIASVLKGHYKQFLLRTLYLVVERSGSSQPFVRASGLFALTRIRQACGYESITDLIRDNLDYLSFHIERKLNKSSESSSGLSVLQVVVKYSTAEVLNTTCNIIRELLFRAASTKTPQNLDSYLEVFKMFIFSLHKWLDIKYAPAIFKTKKQKEEEFKDFKVSGIEPDEDFSDDVMAGKTAEEMYKEDMEKNQLELEQDEPYKKPTPPVYIQLSVAILTQSLHHLPSKNQTRRISILEILKNGVLVLRDWEDELLPIVHQIWSPLVGRFSDGNPLIINFSFQLLVTLARLSKEFIRSRTSKEVLPKLLATLSKLTKESYLKDKGSAYRYSQNYKLQLVILENLAELLIDLDVVQDDFEKSIDVVFQYLSDKQPIPLQDLSLKFFKTLLAYDQESLEEKVKALNTSIEFEKNRAIVLSFLNK